MGGISCSDFYVYDRAADAPGRWHWNGSSWEYARTGDSSYSNNFRAFAENDVWDFTMSGEIAHHYDGTAWRDIALPSSLNSVSAVTGSSGENLWIMGQSKADYRAYLAFRWDGTAWRESPLPASWDRNRTYVAVAVSEQEMYAFGNTSTQGYLRWDGTSWHHEQIPIGIPAGANYAMGAAAADGTVWLGLNAHMLRLDNGTWSETPLPTVPDDWPIRVEDMAADPRSGRVFAGGHAGGESWPRPVLLEYQH
ncbi:hypothetical protein ACFZAV_21870 [Streptomyces sp. NPDC008343]|uniref:hypothetical protein n=1 Tax=Streptomyces sp. NPDC008343 TaxID=3364828 RepID=UPI0036EAA254